MSEEANGFIVPEEKLFPDSAASTPWPRLGWGLFLLLLAGSLYVVFGAPLTLTFGLGVLVAVLFAWRFPEIIFYLFIATAPLLGLLISIPTGRLQIGDRAFGGSIDIYLYEAVALALLVSWAVRLLILRHKQPKRDWRPWLPLLWPYLVLVAAHILSALSLATPDPVLVLKYSLRPVLFVYLICVVLPANLLNRWRHLLVTLGVTVAVGVFFALDGLRSLFVFAGEAAGLHRARPLPIFGYPTPLGGNHNALAEVLLLAVPAALALVQFVRDPRWRRLLYGLAVGMSAVTLLTFARSAWLALGAEAVLLLITVWKPWVKRHKKAILPLVAALLPLAVYMAVFSLQAGVQSSTEARVMAIGVAMEFWQSSPWIGVGAGSFMDRLGRIQAYTMEFGTAIDSHGVIQKLLAETGLVGLLAFIAVLVLLGRIIWSTWALLKRRTAEARAYLFLVAALSGSFIYQLFDTTYWTPRLWLPVGLLLAAGRLLVKRSLAHDPDFLTIP